MQQTCRSRAKPKPTRGEGELFVQMSLRQGFPTTGRVECGHRMTKSRLRRALIGGR